MASKAFTMYAMKDLQPWGQPSYRQITAWADTRYVPGHPAIKKVADINVLNPNYFGTPPAPVPAPAPTPVPGSAYPAYTTTCRVNVRSANSQASPALGIMEANTTVYVASGDYITLQYSRFQPMAAFPNGGFIATQFLRKA